MANKELQGRVVNKHDTETNWAKAVNFIPKKGEIIVYDADDNCSYERIKVGDGATVVSELAFITDAAMTEIEQNVSDLTVSVDELEQWSKTPKKSTVLVEESTGYEYVIRIVFGQISSVCKAESISIAVMPDQTAYAVGEALDLTGLLVYIHRQDGTQEMTSNVTAPATAPADGVVTLTYTEGEFEYTTTMNLTVT